MRETKKIQSDLNRAKAQLQQMEQSYIYSEQDKNVLRPKWEDTIEKLQNEYDTAKAKNIEVNTDVE